jgi:two-component system sensor histidine kinase KdpD
MPLVDAVEVLGSALSRVRGSNSSHRFERNFGIAEANIRADEPLLEQLFFNVLENAVVHTPAKTIVRVGAMRSGERLTITIEDNGPGILGEDWERVFNRFYQGAAGANRRSGSGLGLSIARGFIEVIGGSIHAAPPTGFARGTRIEIILPIAGQYEPTFTPS